MGYNYNYYYYHSSSPNFPKAGKARELEHQYPHALHFLPGDPSTSHLKSMFQLSGVHYREFRGPG